MSRFREVLPLALSQGLLTQKLSRTPEPSPVMNAEDRVLQYGRVMLTSMALLYAAGLEFVYRVRANAGGEALDLACGPGHFTLCLLRYLDYQKVTGIDLSERMVEHARREAESRGFQNRAAFRLGDITTLDGVAPETFDLVSFTNSAHHLADIEAVSTVIAGMDRAAKPDGVVVIMDICRLKTAALTEQYVNLIGADYRALNIPQFFEDFRASMYAAFLPEELRGAIPCQSPRTWRQVVMPFLPSVQFIVGLPAGRTRVFLRPGFEIPAHPLICEWLPVWQKERGAEWSGQFLKDWKKMRFFLFGG
jgi:ubiquinone/menaquinone biosynthesis C-methylase UbiE